MKEHKKCCENFVRILADYRTKQKHNWEEPGKVCRECNTQRHKQSEEEENTHPTQCLNSWFWTKISTFSPRKWRSLCIWEASHKQTIQTSVKAEMLFYSPSISVHNCFVTWHCFWRRQRWNFSALTIQIFEAGWVYLCFFSWRQNIPGTCCNQLMLEASSDA